MNIVLILVGYVAGLCLTYILDVVLCWLEFSEYDFLTYVFGGEYEELGNKVMNTMSLIFWFIYIWFVIIGLVIHFCKRKK